MTITISNQDYWDLFQEANITHQEQSEVLDVTWKYPAVLGQGYRREIELQPGLDLTVEDYQLHKNLIRKGDEYKHPIQYGFLLSGNFKSREDNISPGQNWFCGCGLQQSCISQQSAQRRMLLVNVHIAPQLCQSFIAKPSGEISPELLHLFREPSQEYYYRYGQVTTEMQLALQQILRCPYQGVTKRVYLESKVLEILALMLEQEIELQRGKVSPLSLKHDDLDRIHQAKKILLQRLDNPPSLIELARQVGLNDYTLKRGFRQVFGKTVFSYLHDYRLEQAQQLLARSEMKVTEIAGLIGFDSRSYFAAAFRKKFGMGPKAYQMRYKNSG
ncbi:MAG: AraC family transcriptional regulator [Goleter apudmare HA4340-LM2]|jgi:AraC-like DNA-binding protein|nr:AraC family transcriptional regulator [Goleter apudmare HA4340-LM2]